MFAAFTLVNMVIAKTGSTMVAPASLYFFILVLWLAIGVPATLLGGTIALRAPMPTLPEPTEAEPRAIPAKRRRERIISAAGLLCSAVVPLFLMSTDIAMALEATYGGVFYAQYGRFLVMLLIVVGTVMGISIINTCGAAPATALSSDMHLRHAFCSPDSDLVCTDT